VQGFFDATVLISACTTRGLSADLFRLLGAAEELLSGEGHHADSGRGLGERFKGRPAEIVLVEDQLRAHSIVGWTNRSFAFSRCPIRIPPGCPPRRWQVGLNSSSPAIRTS
jgi:hypothetical protein